MTIRVVVVDDEPDVALLLRVQLGLVDGFEVVGTARDGSEALDVIRSTTPDAVVMDLLMPKVNGFEAIGALKSEFPSVAVVAHTGVAGDFVRNEMSRLGVPLVLKSGDPEQLASVIRRAVGNGHS